MGAGGLLGGVLHGALRCASVRLPAADPTTPPHHHRTHTHTRTPHKNNAPTRRRVTRCTSRGATPSGTGCRLAVRVRVCVACVCVCVCVCVACACACMCVCVLPQHERRRRRPPSGTKTTSHAAAHAHTSRRALDGHPREPELAVGAHGAHGGGGRGEDACVRACVCEWCWWVGAWVVVPARFFSSSSLPRPRRLLLITTTARASLHTRARAPKTPQTKPGRARPPLFFLPAAQDQGRVPRLWVRRP